MKGFFVTEKMKELFFGGMQELVEPTALATIDSVATQELEKDKTIKEITFYFGEKDLDDFKNTACYTKTMMSTIHEGENIKIATHSTTCNVLIGLITTGVHRETSTIIKKLSGGIDTENYHKYVSCEMADQLVTVIKNNKVNKTEDGDRTHTDDLGTVLSIYVPQAYVIGEE